MLRAAVILRNVMSPELLAAANDAIDSPRESILTSRDQSRQQADAAAAEPVDFALPGGGAAFADDGLRAGVRRFIGGGRAGCAFVPGSP